MNTTSRAEARDLELEALQRRVIAHATAEGARCTRALARLRTVDVEHRTGPVAMPTRAVDAVDSPAAGRVRRLGLAR